MESYKVTTTEEVETIEIDADEIADMIEDWYRKEGWGISIEFDDNSGYLKGARIKLTRTTRSDDDD